MLEKINFADLKIHSFQYWDLFLHPNQYPYIGRCYAWAKRAEAESLIDMNEAERNELFQIIIPAWNLAITKLFKHDLSNLAIFSNSARHLHAHFIPRYQEKRIFANVEFTDPNPNGNYSPYPKKKLSIAILQEIKKQIENQL